MSCFLIIGQEPATVPKILEVMRRCNNVCFLCEKWRTFARELGLLETLEEMKLSLEFKCTMENLEQLLFHLLFLWKEKEGEGATLHNLGLALMFSDFPEIGKALRLEFIKILKEGIVGTDGKITPGYPLSLSDIFAVTPGFVYRPKKNDPLWFFERSQIPNVELCTDRMGVIVEQLLNQLNSRDITTLEGYSFVKLLQDDLARRINVSLYNREEKPREIIKKLNLTNQGMHYVFWFLVAAAVLKAHFDNDIRLRQTYRKVFRLEIDRRNPKNCIVTKFRNDVLVYFIDMIVGLWKDNGYELYNLHLHKLPNCWLSTFVFTCLRTNALNLVKDMLSYPQILHKLVRGTMGFDPMELEVRKNLVLEKISQDPSSVNVLDDEGLSPVMMKGIHFELIEALIDKTDAYLKFVDKFGRNFVHLAAEYLPTDQFRKLIRCVIKLKLTDLLEAKDSVERDPLLVSLQNFDLKPDVITVHLLAAGGADFNCRDKYGMTPLYYAVSRRKGPDILEAMVECGSDWSWKNWNNRSLLHIAVREGTLAQVEYFVGIGLDVNAVDSDGNTPLHIAASSRFKGDVVNFLLKNGALR